MCKSIEKISESSPTRLPHRSLFRISACVVMLVAYLGKSADESLPTRLVLNRYWLIAYAIVFRMLFTTDWRRWMRGVQESTDRALYTVASSEAVSRIRSNMSLVSKSSRLLLGQPTGSIAGPQPFLPMESVGDLSLLDITDLFAFSMEERHKDFDAQSFTRKLSAPARKAVHHIQSTVFSSQGNLSQPKRIPEGNDFDVLTFAAAVRIFADWRTVRLVPEGYPGYAVGMNLARRDLLQNVGKMETAVHQYLATHAARPTMLQLIRHEMEQGMHRQLPRITDQSAASGFLWSVRQIEYQFSIFANLALIPSSFAHAKDAVVAAYERIYGDYHGFFVRQIFLSSLKAAPEANVILTLMRGRRRRSNTQETMDVSSDEDEDEWVHWPVDEEETQKKPEPNPLVKEWIKVEQFFTQCIGKGSPKDPNVNMVVSPIVVAVESTDEIPRVLDAMQSYRRIWSETIESLNINDPSKV